MIRKRSFFDLSIQIAKKRGCKKPLFVYVKQPETTCNRYTAAGNEAAPVNGCRDARKRRLVGIRIRGALALAPQAPKDPAAARTGGGVPPPSAPPHRFLVKTGASGSGNLRKSSRGQRKQKSARILCFSFLQAAGVAMATKMKERMIYNETGKRTQERSVL